MKDVDQALLQIANIRAQLAANTRFLGISPEFNLVMAGLAAVIAMTQHQFLSAGDDLGIITLWATVLLASGGIVSVDALTRAKRLHGRWGNTMLAALLLKILPFLVAAVVFTTVIVNYLPEQIWLVPGMWQLLIGLTGFAVLASVPRAMIVVAAWFFLMGSFVLVAAAEQQSLSPWMMGVPFTLGQLAVAYILFQARERGCE
ncbi:hypothetical protein [Halioxenophilus sp. WMMB6]|uniref:hypothetical protein n=1 Tax=Halioxenophilus sp. WMMB6 TaxID=3073815 RepID=UPI00295F3138|nr:hypothetical protein [Halioxenophilus sp. WMMB6]